MGIIGPIIALIVAIVIGQDAKKRGMNAWGWGIGVFLILIIFLPLYFILRKPKLEEAQSIGHQSQQSKSSTSPPTTSNKQPVTNTPSASPITSKKEYFVHIDDKQLGPYDLEKIKIY